MNISRLSIRNRYLDRVTSIFSKRPRLKVRNDSLSIFVIKKKKKTLLHLCFCRVDLRQARPFNDLREENASEYRLEDRCDDGCNVIATFNYFDLYVRRGFALCKRGLSRPRAAQHRLFRRASMRKIQREFSWKTLQPFRFFTCAQTLIVSDRKN